MPRLTYKEIAPIGAVMLIGATCFGLGVAYAQLPYDLNTLWREDTIGNAFEKSINHYAQWGTTPRYVHHIFHGVMAIGLAGCFIKLYKPQEDSKYFEYGTLILYMAGVIIYLTNLRVGVNSCVSGEWGEVDSYTGINVVAASEVIIVVVLIGVLLLQGGLYYAEWYDSEVAKEILAKEAEEEAKLAETDSKQQSKNSKSSGKSTGVKSKKSD